MTKQPRRLVDSFSREPQDGFTPGAWAALCADTFGLSLPLAWWSKWGDLVDDCGPTSQSLDAPYLDDEGDDVTDAPQIAPPAVYDPSPARTHPWFHTPI